MKVYICGISYRHEIGEAADGNKIYYSVKSFRKYSGCDGNGCGIVELELNVDNKVWIEPENHDNMMAGALSAEESRKYLTERYKQNIKKLEEHINNLSKEAK